MAELTKWEKKLKAAEDVGGVSLSEMDCYELRHYITALRTAVQSPPPKK